MSDPKHPTNQGWELFDPLLRTPPRGVSLLLINNGGKLIVGPWYHGALAWGYNPSIPQSVKDRISPKRKSCPSPT